MDPFARMVARLIVIAEGDGSEPGGGGGDGGIDPAKHAKLSAEHAALKTEHARVAAEHGELKKRLETLERLGKKAAGEHDQAEGERKAADEARARELEEAKAAQAKALGIAKGALVRAALPGLVKDDYLRLAPDVELDEGGALTKGSVDALEKWKKDNAILFRGQGGGRTPVSGAGPEETHFSPEDLRGFSINRIDPSETAKRLGRSPLVGILGYQAKPRAERST